MKPLVFMLSLTLMVLQYKLWLGDNSVFALLSLKQESMAQMQSNESAASMNQMLEEEILGLKNNSDALEEKARYELGMVKPGEEYYHIID